MEWNQPELEEQAETLARMFFGNKHFESIRGRLNGPFVKIVCGLLYDENKILKSRTKGSADTEKFLASVSWVQEKIGQLERKKMFQAAKEVREALITPNYFMLGEKNLPKKTTITLVMFEAKLTLKVLSLPIKWQRYGFGGLPRKLRRTLNCFDSHGGIYQKYVFDGLRVLYAPYLEKITRNSPKIWITRNYVRCLKNISEINETEITHGIMQVFNATQKEIMSVLDSEENKRTAFWEFQVPYYDIRNFPKVGLHLSAEHPYWQKLRGKFCSLNTSFGRGAVYQPGESYNCFDQKSKVFKGTRMIS